MIPRGSGEIMRIVLVLAVAIPLAGCVASQPTYTADGQQGHVITCTPGWTGGIVGAVANASTSWGQFVPGGTTSSSKSAKVASMDEGLKAEDLCPRQTTA
jgi:hypothetical protein